MNELVLSLFPGVDLLGRAFSAAGYTVVAGPDPIVGGDIRDFAGVIGRFDGVIGGPPCQGFSAANTQRTNKSGLVRKHLTAKIRGRRKPWPAPGIFQVLVTTGRWLFYLLQKPNCKDACFTGFQKTRKFESLVDTGVAESIVSGVTNTCGPRRGGFCEPSVFAN